MVFNLEESESQLQDYFIELLKNNGYEYVDIENEADLMDNFEKQLKLFNNDVEFNFQDIWDYLSQGDKNSKFDKLRGSYNGVKFIDFSNFSSNIFQVAEEITVEGEYKNRYDVTILINGFPLVQIELKRPGGNLITAFNQIQRYSNHSYSGLFDFIQIFVISNKANTKYFFNDSDFNYNLTYNWFDNKDLESFTHSFLIKNNLMLILSGYIFKDLISNNYIMLRQYQIDALTDVLEKINAGENGYVWLTSNTGCTTTALRLAQILSENNKVIFITKDKFSNLNVSKTQKELLQDINLKNLIFTNINILSLKEKLDSIKDNDFIFIFDDYEKYSSKNNPLELQKIFKNSLFYCFTQTPVFDENIIGEMTTKTIFNSKIYNYTFSDALKEKTNLPINIEYVNDAQCSKDYNLSSDIRIAKISDYIVDNFNKKSILIVSSNNDLIRYYESLKSSNLKVAPILRHESNDIYESTPMRDYFEKYIHEFNDNFNAEITHKKVVGTEKISHEFEEDTIKRFKNNEIDLVIVDASLFLNQYNFNILGNLKDPQLDTIYLDCELEYNNLFEVLTMGNIPASHKSYGNVVMFRDLRENIKKAVKLFSNNQASEDIPFKDYDYYLKQYNNSFDDFKKLSYYYNILITFDEFNFDKSQSDEFNALKDEFEQEQFEINSIKKIITNFNLQKIDNFTIDLNYLIYDEDNEEYEESTINTDNPKELNILNLDNSKEINETRILNLNNTKEELNILSLNKVDNSKELNVINQDLSKTINVTNEYHIYVGGDNIQNEINLNLKDLIKSNAIQTDDENVKICPRCREKYTDDKNFCPKHEELTELVYIDDLIKVCKGCGLKYPKEFNYCISCDCDEPLTTDIIDIKTLPNRYYDLNTHINKFTEISQLLSNENKTKLINFNFTQLQFDNIINNIKNTYKLILDYLIDEYGIDLSNLSTLNKMLLFSKTFVKTDYKEGGGDLGYYQYNEIFIDDRLPDALQITTIIHELSHFLMAEILEQITCEILNTNKTDAVEAFICYNLANVKMNCLVDEYCAHTVEGRFAMFGYQDYGSYKQVLSEFLQEYSEQHVEIVNTIGNTFADYIKPIMESFIDENLRKDIKKEFSKVKDVPKYDELQYETSNTLDWEGFSNAIKLMLTGNLKDFENNPQDMEKLNVYAVKFRKNNQR